ncbi:MAG: tRNA-dihydrouridine synthase [Candidatus Omnitrophota bacterium]
MLKIGSYELPSNIILAPLAGCSDLAFRLIAREHGAKLCFFEMVDNNAIVYAPGIRTDLILKTLKKDNPIAAQLLGRDPAMMLKGAREIMKMANIAFLDINAACPAKKAVKKKTGAYLLKDEKALNTVIKTLAAALPVPITVKIRIGYDIADLKALKKIVKGCEASGASAIFVHGRTRAQGYSGDIDYEAIKVVKDSVKVPVIGSGNIFTAAAGFEMLAKTGCDGITVARGALGNPWIFTALAKKTIAPIDITVEERIKVLKKHLALLEKHKNCSSSGKIGFMRKVALWYVRGFPNAPQLRGQISIVKSYPKMLELINTIDK